jgi:hypothetical protein
MATTQGAFGAPGLITVYAPAKIPPLGDLVIVDDALPASVSSI